MFRTGRFAPLALAAVAGLLACSGPEEGGGEARARIGPAGGTVEAPGVKLSIPPGALSKEVEVQILSGDFGAPEVTERVRVSRVFQVLPQEIKLSSSARITLAYQRERLPESIPASAADVRRTDFSREIERLGALVADAGAQTISGETLGFGTFWATAPLAPRPAWVEVSPAEKVVFVGAKVAFSAEVRDQTERVMPGAPVVWESSDPSVATIDESGEATALGPGVTEISARAGAALGKARLQVASPEPFARDFTWENPLPQGNPLHAVSGDATALVVAGAGVVLARDAAGWRQVLRRSPELVFEDIAIAGGRGVAVGAVAGQGVLVAWNGEDLEELQVPDTELEAVWTDMDIGMAVGPGPNMAVLEGSGWRAIPSPVTEPLLAAGAAKGRMRVVGARGSVYERVGEAWIALATGTLPQIQIDAVSRGAELYAISRDTLRRFAGGAWEEVALPESPALVLQTIGLAGAALVLAATGEQGETYVLVEKEEGFAVHAFWPERIHALWGRSATDLYAACDSGAIYAFDGQGWRNLRQGSVTAIAGLAAFEGPRVFAIANVCLDESCRQLRGIVLERGADGVFAEMSGPFETPLRAVGGQGPHDLWAVGDYGVTYHFQGEGWVVGSAPGSLNALGSCGEALYAAGSAGKLYQRRAGSWTQIFNVGWNTLRAVSCGGDAVFAVGDYAIVRYRDGEGALLDPLDDGLRPTQWRAVWATPDGKALVGGDARYILFWNGAKFEYFDRPGDLDVASVRALWGRSFGEVWAAGMLADGSGVLLHFNGAFWESVEPGTVAPLNAVTGLADGTLWIAGERGAVLRGGLDD
ncbi:MAG: Ig-like domain-containing protein [Myxococcales bacterium]|jgi:hypothetical protein